MEKAKKDLELILKYFTAFTPGQLDQLKALDELYKDWNSKINVISRKDIDSLYEKHILHSLSIATIAGFRPGTEIIDIGTGGGFPGIPLAIFFPDVQFHLVDSIGKKLKVVEEVASSIGLSNVSTQHIRVEQIRNRKFDFAVSRAVAPLKDLWNWSKPLLRKTGSSFTQAVDKTEPETSGQSIAPGMICLKGGDLKNEISESGMKPTVVSIHEIFAEEFFRDKHIVYVKL